MRKQAKMWLCGGISAGLMLAASMTSFAGSWVAGQGADQGKWWYDNGNGSYTAGGWQWIDGNGDGTAESYYFDGNGWLLTNTTTPDGYTVNGDGAWVVDGVVQTSAAAVQAVQGATLSESDFVVSGDNSVTRSVGDHSILTNWNQKSNNVSGIFHAFAKGDSITTARGITFGNTKQAVKEKYGEASSYPFDIGDRWYYALQIAGPEDAAKISVSATTMEYYTKPYGIKFYFDASEQLIGIIYFRDDERQDSAPVPVNNGHYIYTVGELYVKNNGKYELYSTTRTFSDENYDDISEEMVKIGMYGDLNSFDYEITQVENRKIKIDDGWDTGWNYYEYKNGEWILTGSVQYGQVYSIDPAAEVDKIFLEGDSFGFENEFVVRGDYSEENTLYPLSGKEVMRRYVYKRR